jgi:hypothetical protein
MIEAASKLKTSNLFGTGSKVLICLQLKFDMEKALNGSFDVGLLEFGLIMQINKKLMLFMVRILDEFEPDFEVIHCM